MDNPYRTDYPGQGPFYGRTEELAELREAVRTGRQSIAAVMGGRGMGKSSFAVRLRELLRQDGVEAVHLIRRPQSDPALFFEQMGNVLGASLSLAMPTESIVDAVDAGAQSPVVLLIDEVEMLLRPGPVTAMLDNLRAAWEELAGKLAIAILGGSRLRELLSSDASPFLRSARWIPLRGLSRAETADLLREPCRLDIPDAVVDVLWAQTGGHPLLLQATMVEAVGRAIDGESVIDQLPAAMEHVDRTFLEPTLFPMWWANLQQRGQNVYRTLLDCARPVGRSERVSILGREPGPWIEILETTGVGRADGDEVLPRGVQFRAWMERNHPARTPVVESAQPPWQSACPPAHPLETSVVTGTARWARDVVEHPTMALKSPHAKGNNRLLHELDFQLQLLFGLRQRELLVEAEPLSSARGRVDLKVRWPRERDRRACIELKIWARNDYRDVVSQLLGYAVAEDTFGCVVMIDRQARPLEPAYRSEVLAHGPPFTEAWSREDNSAAHPALITEHPRPQAGPLRIYHFLVQLPSDAAG